MTREEMAKVGETLVNDVIERGCDRSMRAALAKHPDLEARERSMVTWYDGKESGMYEILEAFGFTITEKNGRISVVDASL